MSTPNYASMTKARLIEVIHAKDAALATLQKAVRLLTATKAVSINVPKSCRGTDPNVRGRFVSTPDGLVKDYWQEEVMKFTFETVKTEGVPSYGDYAAGDGGRTVNIRTGGHEAYTSITVPEHMAGYICGILNRALTYGDLCYAQGHRDGAALLKRLAEGTCTADSFNDQCERVREPRHVEPYKIRPV